MSDYPNLRAYIKEASGNLAEDPRYSQTKRDRQCWNNYADYFRCLAVRQENGKDTVPCEFFRNQVSLICPRKWTKEWDEMRAQGCFPANKYALEPESMFGDTEQ